MRPLTDIICIEITVDQACAIMGSIETSMNENQDWIDNNPDSPNRGMVEEMQNYLKDIGYQITKKMGVNKEEE